MLASALLAATAVASTARRRATVARVAAARAGTEARRVAAEVLLGWDGAADSLAVGAELHRAVSTPATNGLPISVRAHIRRLAPDFYSVVAAVRVGPGARGVAFRRLHLLLERIAPADSGEVRSLVPLVRWSVVDRQ